jgi:hypothetical protein
MRPAGQSVTAKMMMVLVCVHCCTVLCALLERKEEGALLCLALLVFFSSSSFSLLRFPPLCLDETIGPTASWLLPRRLSQIQSSATRLVSPFYKASTHTARDNGRRRRRRC